MGWTQRSLASWCLVLALLPSVAFLGHWGVSVSLPRDLGDVVLLPSETAHHDHHDGGSHDSHCHSDAASCTDVPFAAAGAFAVLRDAAAAPSNSLVAESQTTGRLALAPVNTVSPEPQPPRLVESAGKLSRSGLKPGHIHER